MHGYGIDGSRGWASSLWAMLSDGGIYGIPRCGLVFRKNELAKQLTLIERMPWDPAMPVTAEELFVAQEDDLQGMTAVMASIGVTVLMYDGAWPLPFGNARPYPGNLIKCPKCGHRRFDYMAEDYGACERRQCGYEWRP